MLQLTAAAHAAERSDVKQCRKLSMCVSSGDRTYSTMCVFTAVKAMQIERCKSLLSWRISFFVSKDVLFSGCAC